MRWLWAYVVITGVAYTVLQHSAAGQAVGAIWTGNVSALLAARAVRSSRAGGTDSVVAVVGCLETTPRQLVLTCRAVLAGGALCVGGDGTLG